MEAHMLRFLMTSALILAMSAAAMADVVELKDGKTINGRYAGGDGATVRVETKDGVQVLERGNMVSITFVNEPAAAQPAEVTIAPAASAAPQAISLPAGTPLMVRMMDSISSQNKPGTRFTTTLENDIAVNGVVVLKAG